MRDQARNAGARDPAYSAQEGRGRPEGTILAVNGRSLRRFAGGSMAGGRTSSDLGPAGLVSAAARRERQPRGVLLDWVDVRAAADPRATALEFLHSVFRHACNVCDWDTELAATADGMPPPVK